jgi:CheY-like chemotaxis protein
MTRRVLVVDDEEAIRMLVQRLLVRAGYEVTTARDGCEAIEALAAGEYDAVLLDVMMPRLDGFGVVETMRARCPSMLARTLLVTAANLQRLDELPVRGVLPKPFDVAALLRETELCIEATALVPQPEAAVMTAHL